MNKLFTLLTVIVFVCGAASPAPAKPSQPTHVIYIGDSVKHCVLPLGFVCSNSDHWGFKVRKAHTENGTVVYQDLVSKKRRELTITTTDFLVVEL